MDAAQFIKMLYVLNEEMRTKAGPGTVIWTSPRLKDCANFVERLKTGLAEANRAMLQGRMRPHKGHHYQNVMVIRIL